MVFVYCAYFMQNGTLRQGSESGQIDTGVQSLAQNLPVGKGWRENMACPVSKDNLDGGYI